MTEFKKYAYIDSLRGIAILLAILPHIALLNPAIIANDTILPYIVQTGKFAIQLFFVTSAYTLMLSYNNRKDETKGTLKFIIRRVFRIAPLYYLAALIIVCYKLSLTEFTTKDSYDLITHLLFINTIFPKYIIGFIPGGWSISVEFLFYIFVPFLCRYITNLNRALVVALVSIVVCFILSESIYYLLNIYAYQNYNWAYKYYTLIPQLPIFTMGFLCYWIANTKDIQIKSSVLLLTVFVILFYAYNTMPIHYIYGIGFAVLLITQSKKAYSIFSNKLFAQVGKVSFSMYIVHFFVIFGLSKFNIGYLIQPTNQATALLNFAIIYLLIAVIAYVVSYFSYKLIEVPGQNLGKKLIKYVDKKDTMVA